MKKLLLLTFVFTLFACSIGDGNCGEGARAGTWSGNYQIDSGDSGTWTLVPDEPDGFGYINHTGSLFSDVYGSMDFSGDIDAEGETTEGLLTFTAVTQYLDFNAFLQSSKVSHSDFRFIIMFGSTSESSPIEYDFVGFVVCNDVVEAIISVDGDYGAGTFTATKN